MTALAACLQASIAAVDEAMSGAESVRLKPDGTVSEINVKRAATGRAERAIEAVRAALKPYWRGL